MINERRNELKYMADLLRAGATMLTQICPHCKVPLFKLKSGEIICPSCGKKVLFIKKGDLRRKSSILTLTSELEEVLNMKLSEITNEIARSNDLEKTLKLLEAAKIIVDVIIRIRKLREE
ncbi:MAG: hypothetical protein DRJ20_00400 [Candidatus Methanomethylicota archaeon]|uniref:Sjogrens syndrome scleroderma autoantigen 1 n=1 Tax=Thermoproteota archaeon TaxID=2056631 RepID=A0A497EYK5_9CREN|nr:MAG: hypothetical protein DRJ20_00400 [Candidatus Verstraetearchaeota archaeon]